MKPTAAAKVLNILGAFTPDSHALTLSQIARRADLALSTAHRIVAELLAWGALERGPDGRYAVGLRLYSLGALAPRGTPLRDAAMPVMEDLYELTHEVVQLAVRDGAELVFTERLAGRTSVGVHTQVGLQFPLPPSGAGLVLLAFAPADVQEAVLCSPLRRFTPMTITDPVRLRTILSDVRSTGIATSDRQVTMDSLSVAAPIRDPSSAVVAAVSLVVHAGSHDINALGNLIAAAARAITRSLAGPPALQSATNSIGPRRHEPASSIVGRMTLAPSYNVRPLDASTWSAFAELVERNGGIFGGCWCIGFHPERGERGISHRAAKEERVRTDRAHAALVLDSDDLAQGWCQYGSPEELSRIKHRRKYDQDAPPLPDWRITCFYVDKHHRGKGIARAALAGALDQIADAGGGLVEAIPEVTDGREAQGRFLYSATVELFEDYGFTRVRQVGKHAWIVSRVVDPA